MLDSIKTQHQKLEEMGVPQNMEVKLKDWCRILSTQQFEEKEKKIDECEAQNKKQDQEIFELITMMKELIQKNELLWEANENNTKTIDAQKDMLSDTNKRLANSLKDQKKMET